MSGKETSILRKFAQQTKVNKWFPINIHKEDAIEVRPLWTYLSQVFSVLYNRQSIGYPVTSLTFEAKLL